VPDIYRKLLNSIKTATSWTYVPEVPHEIRWKFTKFSLERILTDFLRRLSLIHADGDRKFPRNVDELPLDYTQYIPEDSTHHIHHHDNFKPSLLRFVLKHGEDKNDTVSHAFTIHLNYLGFEVFTQVVMKNTVFWDIMPCSPLKVNRRFRGTYRLHFQGRISRVRYLICHLFLRWYLLNVGRRSTNSNLHLKCLFSIYSTSLVTPSYLQPTEEQHMECNWLKLFETWHMPILQNIYTVLEIRFWMSCWIIELSFRLPLLSLSLSSSLYVQQQAAATNRVISLALQSRIRNQHYRP
jgi:hypothetical protein